MSRDDKHVICDIEFPGVLLQNQASKLGTFTFTTFVATIHYDKAMSTKDKLPNKIHEKGFM